MPEYVEVAITIWTIRAALLCMFVAFWIPMARPRGDASVSKTARLTWLVGSLFSILHFLAAMGFYHHGSHDLAFQDTANKTEILMGVRVGIGVYFNYLFVLLWFADAIWWMARPRQYERRSKWIQWSVLGYLSFIAFNGAIIFESGPIRWIASIGLIVLAGKKVAILNARDRS